MKKHLLFILSIILMLSAKIVDIEVYDNQEKEWKTSNSHYVKQGESVSLRIPFSPKDIKSVQWYQIIPDVSKYYKNANHPYEPNPYKWVGFGKITYNRVPLPTLTNRVAVEITPSLLKASSPKGVPYHYDNLGSFWFQVEIVLKNGEKLRSVGISDNDHRGLSPKVFRLSYMLDYTYMGYLTSFLNVPGIFGSVPYQCKNYIGADCADVLMAARSIYRKQPLKDYNVAMLVRKFPHRSKATLNKGTPNKKLKWGEDVQVGDFIAVRYSPKAQFAHIGVLFRDNNKNGLLDKDDIVLHAGPHALHASRLSERGFDGEVVFLQQEGN